MLRYIPSFVKCFLYPFTFIVFYGDKLYSITVKRRTDTVKRGTEIKLFRLLNGLSQDDISALFVVGRGNVSMIESMRFNLRSDLMNCIEQAFFVSPKYYHFGEHPIFVSNVVFFANKGKITRNDIDITTTLLQQFIQAHEINQAFIINKTVLMLIVISQIPQYIFIYSDATEQIALRIKTLGPSISIKTISLDVELTENDIERYFNFPFPKEKVFKFIKSFFSIINPKLVFHSQEFKKLIEESKDFIVKKVKNNKILEIFEIMESYKITSQDLKSYNPYAGKEFHGYPPPDEKEWKG